MENASKALIIAGAILLSILLISLGIAIFSQAQTVIDGSGMSDAEVQAFNSKFEKYQGAKKGSVIRSMVQEVMSNNNSSQASDETRVSINANNKIGATTVAINSTEVTNNLITLQSTANAQPVYGSAFSNTKTYTVSFVWNDGRIAIIQVK